MQCLYNNEKDYYHLTSERSILCDIGDNSYCHVLLIINRFYNNKYNLIYSSKKKINKRYIDYIQDLFPTITDYFQSSNSKNYLLLDSKKMKHNIDNYILLTIECGKKIIYQKIWILHQI